jgi:hypothetical protein
MSNGFCFVSLNAQGECSCTSVLGVKGSCWVDQDDSNIYGGFLFMITIALICHVTLLGWTIWLLIDQFRTYGKG